jgi:hypothetical protein
MFLGLLNPDPLLRGMDLDPAPDPSIVMQKKENLDSYCLVTLLDFLSLKSKKQKNFFLNYFFVGIMKVNDEKSRIRIPDPDPLVRGMDPRIRIRIHTKCHGSAPLGSRNVKKTNCLRVC